jgi:diguanylate cyclase (GGDEF)-like protein
MDIEVVIKKGIAYSVATASIAMAYVGLILSSEQIIQNTVADATLMWPFVVAGVVVSAVAFEPLRSFVQNVVDRAFFKTRYDYQEAIQAYSKMVVTILDLDELLDRTVISITDMLRIHQAIIFLRDHDTGTFDIAAFSGSDERDLKGWSYAVESPLVKHLEAESRVAEDIDERAKGSVFVSLRVHRSLVGFLMLGEKLSGDVYTVTDLQLLKTLADQLGIAVENARLYRAAVTDKLTKAFTGNYFYERLDEELARSATHGTALSILFFDVDKFTEFSKARGSAVSDEALALIGKTIKDSIQVYDVSARIGDDEFALILPGTDREGAAFLAGTIKKRVSELTIDGESGVLRVCAGASYTKNGQKTARLMMNDARTRLLKSKELKTKQQELLA